jgi:mitogen-activated protein kinase kinase 3
MSVFLTFLHFCVAGRGAYGVVEKMKHKQTGTILAVKRITATVNSVEQRRLLMDLDISMRSSGTFYFYFFTTVLYNH